MPWTEKDVDRHFKGLSTKEKRQWCHVANGALESGDDDGTACHKANGVVQKSRITSHMEALLYQKAAAMIETVRMAEIASIFESNPLDNEPEGVLSKNGWTKAGEAGKTTHYVHPEKGGQIHVNPNGNWRHYDKNGECLQAGFTGEKLKKHLGESVDLMEADPRPRVEKDINGKPVIPNRQHYLNYFQGMHHEHIKAGLEDARKRWDVASKDADSAKKAAEARRDKSSLEAHKMAQAHLKALGHEMSMGKSVLTQKQRQLKKQQKPIVKKIKTHNKNVGKAAKGVASGLFGKSPLMQKLVHGAATSLFSKKEPK